AWGLVRCGKLVDTQSVHCDNPSWRVIGLLSTVWVVQLFHTTSRWPGSSRFSKTYPQKTPLLPHAKCKVTTNLLLLAHDHHPFDQPRVGLEPAGEGIDHGRGRRAVRDPRRGVDRAGLDLGDDPPEVVGHGVAGRQQRQLAAVEGGVVE